VGRGRPGDVGVTAPLVVAVPAVRLERWVANFGERHGGTRLDVADGALHGTAADGSAFSASPPFARSYDGSPAVSSFVEVVRAPERWGVLLVRKGGFAVARLAGPALVEHKIGQRHVQGRTKAGGQSQQRFARRRDNQARAAYEAAADHAARILTRPALPVVTGGDHGAVDDVLADVRLRHVTVTGPWLAVPDPRRQVLDGAVVEAMSVRVEVVNA
jgi:Actinobacteria/chloroflexi VLRF1 release factor